MTSTPSLFLVFIAGIVTLVRLNIILLLPAVMSMSVGRWFKPLAIVGGMTLSFTLMGTFVVISDFDVAFTNLMIRSLSILFMIGMGTVLFAEDINMEFIKRSSSITDCLKSKIGFLNRHSSNMSWQGLFSSFFFGMSLGIAWIPFLGLGVVLAYATSMGSISYGVWLLFVYSLGFSIPILFIAYLGNILFGHINWFIDRKHFFKKYSGLLLIVVGLILLLNILLIRWLSPYFPYL